MHQKMVKMIRRMAEKEKAVRSKKRQAGKKWFLYILQCGDGSLYTGITNDLDRRFEMHSKGRGAKYTRSRRPLTMVYSEKCRNKVAAMVRECAVKAYPKKKKAELISKILN
jgi:predicted GIY-YIG superfamily endonuclease